MTHEQTNQNSDQMGTCPVSNRQENDGQQEIFKTEKQLLKIKLKGSRTLSLSDDVRPFSAYNQAMKIILYIWTYCSCYNSGIKYI
jgi:hypothetical protein